MGFGAGSTAWDYTQRRNPFKEAKSVAVVVCKRIAIVVPKAAIKALAFTHRHAADVVAGEVTIVRESSSRAVRWIAVKPAVRPGHRHHRKNHQNKARLAGIGHLFFYT